MQLKLDIQDFSLRSLTRADELLAIMELQQLVYLDGEAYQTQYYTLIDLMRNGGVILGAYDANMMIGFLVAFLGAESRDPRRPAMANLKLCLERIGVHPDYRRNDVATQLLLRLREIANQQGIRLVTYALDPLDSRAAYLAIGKLGAIGRSYVPDYYGVRDADGYVIGSSDRIVAEWWVTHNRVDERLHGNRTRLQLQQYLDAETPLLNPTRKDDGLVYPYQGAIAVPKGRQMLLLEIAPDDVGLSQQDDERATLWKQHVRDGLQTLTQAGYVATDFLYEQYEGRDRAFYVMSFDGPRMMVQF